jgi:hypothetical protein
MRNSDLRVDSLFAKPAKVKYSVSALLTPMKISSVCYLHSLIAALALAPATAQTNQQGSPAPVPYASVSALNTLLSDLEQASQSAQVDLAKLRIERWKADGGTKRQALSNVESLERNLQSALPEIITQLRNSPENLSSTFKLYRNLDALYDVFASVVESAGAFGPKDEFQSLENDLSGLERSRRSFADRIEVLSGQKETELARLRIALQNAQAANAQPPKKVVVDDTEPPKKAIKKKAPSKTAPVKPNATTTPSPPQPQSKQ